MQVRRMTSPGLPPRRKECQGGTDNQHCYSANYSSSVREFPHLSVRDQDGRAGLEKESAVGNHSPDCGKDDSENDADDSQVL
jgi:hypothetical protein